MNNLNEAVKMAVESKSCKHVPVQLLVDAQTQLEKAREIHESAKALLQEAQDARDRELDVTQASYWSGRANALSELIKLFQERGL